MRVVWVNESAIQSSSFHEFNFKAHSYCFSAKPLTLQYTYLWTCSIYLPTVLSTSGKTHQFPSHAPWCIFHHGYGPVQAGAAVSTFLLSYFVFLFPELIVSFTNSKGWLSNTASPFWYSPANSQFCWHHWIWIFPRSSFFYSVGYLSDTKIIK